MKKIVIDTRGNDNGLEVFLEGALLGSENYPNYSYVFVGDEVKINSYLKHKKINYEVINAPETFLNTDNPAEIARGKDETSLVKALNALKSDDECVAMISAGSTGGFLVGSIFRLGLLDGIKFPALASPMINIHQRWFALLDCGANIDVDAKRLYKFAQMGSGLMKSAFGNIENPRVGLLNVGKEPTKGNAVLKETYPLLKESSLNFIGNIEGHDIYLNKADVVVCDGYTGNVFLKGASALAEICERIVLMNDKEDPNIQKASKTIHKMFNYNEQGAAIILGTKKICLKAHGTATSETIVSSVRFAVNLDQGGFIRQMEEELSK